MGAWGRDQKSAGKVRMMADGSADFAKATGLTLDLTGRGMGLRSNRYSMLVKDGVVKSLNVEAPGKFEVSDADTMLRQAKELRLTHSLRFDALTAGQGIIRSFAGSGPVGALAALPNPPHGVSESPRPTGPRLTGWLLSRGSGTSWGQQ